MDVVLQRSAVSDDRTTARQRRQLVQIRRFGLVLKMGRYRNVFDWLINFCCDS